MQTFEDQMGRTIQLDAPPKRIISLVPSQTELLFYLGLDETVVGITKFCFLPEAQFKKKPKVGGTKKLHLDWIQDLNPDLIIGNKEENDKQQVEALMQKFPVWMSDIYTLNDALIMIKSVGRLVNRPAEAKSLNTEIKQHFNDLAQFKTRPIRAAYLIWRDPIFVAGSNTFIHEMMKLGGFENVFGDQDRYPQITPEELRSTNPEVLLLSSEPFPFKEKHRPEFEKICPKTVTCLVDGTLFSWYGNRLLHAAPYFINLHATIWQTLQQN